MQPLYKLSEQLHALESDEDIDQQTFEDTMEALEGDFENKCLSVGKFVKAKNDEAAFVDVEIKRLAQRKKQCTYTADRVKEYLRVHMLANDKSKFSDPIITLSMRKGSQRLELTGKAPAQFVTTETVEKVDKRGITAAMKEGAAFDNCELVRGDESLMIK